jgi:hypothetical protein
VPLFPWMRSTIAHPFSLNPDTAGHRRNLRGNSGQRPPPSMERRERTGGRGSGPSSKGRRQLLAVRRRQGGGEVSPDVCRRIGVGRGLLVGTGKVRFLKISFISFASNILTF